MILTEERIKALAKQHGLYPFRVKGTDRVVFARKLWKNLEAVTWKLFFELLQKSDLVVYCNPSNDFMKILRRETAEYAEAETPSE